MQVKRTFHHFPYRVDPENTHENEAVSKTHKKEPVNRHSVSGKGEKIAKKENGSLFFPFPRDFFTLSPDRELVHRLIKKALFYVNWTFHMS